MKTQMIINMVNDSDVKISLSVSGPGFDNKDLVEKETLKYKKEAELLGMSCNGGVIESVIIATPENCAPYVAFAERNNLEIIQL